MKVFLRLLMAILVAGLFAGYFYWQKNKKGILKNAFQERVQKKTDSLYFLHYDSSNIDEINGNASFYKVTLQSDSAQKSMLDSKDSLPNALYNISIDKVTARGIDMTGILQKTNCYGKKYCTY